MNSINWPAVWVFIAQLVEHCSANAEATCSNPCLKPQKSFFFFRLVYNCSHWSHLQFVYPNQKRLLWSIGVWPYLVFGNSLLPEYSGWKTAWRLCVSGRRRGSQHTYAMFSRSS